MNKKKIAVLIMLFMAVIGFCLSSVSAVNIGSSGGVSPLTIDIGSNGIYAPYFHYGPQHKHNTDRDSNCYKKYNKKCKYYGYSELNIIISGSSKQLNKVKKATVKVSGKKTKKNYS